MTLDWGAIYGGAVTCLALSYGVRVILFLALRPDTIMEWATTAAAASIFAFFAILTYWLDVVTSGPRPAIFPPLVVAAVVAMVTSVAFTIIAVRDWLQRR